MFFLPLSPRGQSLAGDAAFGPDRGMEAISYTLRAFSSTIWEKWPLTLDHSFYHLSIAIIVND